MAIAGLVMKIANVKLYGITLVVSVLSLSTIYFIMAYASKANAASATEIFINKVSSFGNSIALVGILFTIQNWEGSLKMMVVGSLTLLIAVCIGFYKGVNFDNRKRSLVILAVCTFLFLTPAETLRDLNIIHSAQQVPDNTQH